MSRYPIVEPFPGGLHWYLLIYGKEVRVGVSLPIPRGVALWRPHAVEDTFRNTLDPDNVVRPCGFLAWKAGGKCRAIIPRTGAVGLDMGALRYAATVAFRDLRKQRRITVRYKPGTDGATGPWAAFIRVARLLDPNEAIEWAAAEKQADINDWTRWEQELDTHRPGTTRLTPHTSHPGVHL